MKVEKLKNEASAPKKKEKTKGKEKMVAFFEVPVASSPPRKRMKLEATTSVVEDKGRYPPEWELTSDTMVGEVGMCMNFFKHYFPPGSKKVMEIVPTDILIVNAYRQQFEVCVVFESQFLYSFWM